MPHSILFALRRISLTYLYEECLLRHVETRAAVPALRLA